MKTKLLLITIGSIVLLFTSCEKDDMGTGIGGTGGGTGGMENSNRNSSLTQNAEIPLEVIITANREGDENHIDTLSDRPKKLLDNKLH